MLFLKSEGAEYEGLSFSLMVIILWSLLFGGHKTIPRYLSAWLTLSYGSWKIEIFVQAGFKLLHLILHKQPLLPKGCYLLFPEGDVCL